MEHNTAIVLAAGRGSRMHSDIPKQFMQLHGMPVVCHSLSVFERFEGIADIILVTGEEDVQYCCEEIVGRYGFSKVQAVVAGGAERYDSVYNGLQASAYSDYIMIHDGARPLIDEMLLHRSLECVRKCGACVAGMPVKDTIKQCDSQGTVIRTPDRSSLWIVQTPQTFEGALIKQAYEAIYDGDREGLTDDAMVVERFTGHSVTMAEGSYKNIKLTTPEDFAFAEAIIGR